MKRFGMDYPTAVRDVARRSGIVIPDRPAQAGPDPNEPLYGAVAAAHDWFVRQLAELPEARVARDYLAERGITPEQSAELLLGYSPRGSASLDAMRTLGIKDPVLLSAGLVAKREDGSIVPRFRGRLIFPIHDTRGRVVAFGGRILGPGEPKYLNSPESDIFRKGRTLYNLHAARHAMRREEMVILVEGYFDVIRLVLAGVENVVAPLGTALTHEQAALLKRYAPAATLLYDSDQAGLKATFRAGDELLRHDMRVKVATMPPGEDPDTLARKGGLAALEPILADAVDVLERKIQLLERRGWFDDLEHRREALDRLLPTVRAAADPITRELYLSRVAERAGIEKRVLEGEAFRVAAAPARTEDAGDSGSDATARIAEPRLATPSEWELLRIMFVGNPWLDLARRQVDPGWIRSPAARELFNAALQHGERLIPGTDLELSEPAFRLWDDVRARIGELATQDVQSIYDGVWQMLAARPLVRDYVKLRSQMLAAKEVEKSEIMTELKKRKQEIRERYPLAYDKWTFRGRAGARRPPRRP
jgi:DNA primase